MPLTASTGLTDRPDHVDTPSPATAPSADLLSPATAPARGPRATDPERDPHLDNAKLLAIVLVVVGHAWNNLRDLPLVEGGYLLLYLFHMPLFVLLAGYLGRRATTVTPHRAQQLMAGLVVPYLLFQAPYGYLADVALIDHAEPGVVSPAWLMWFLAALACWRLTAPLWARVRAPVAVAVAVSLVGGVTTAGELALTQVLGLLPFFVAGLCLRAEHLALLRTRAARVAAVAVLAVAGSACLLAAPVTDREMEWVYWRSGYAELGVGLLEGGLLRLGLLAAGFVLAAAFLALAPRRPMRFTPLGAHTLYAYLLHGFVVLAAMGLGLFDLAEDDPLLGVPLVTGGAVLLTGALLSAPVRQAMQPVVRPGLGWLWRRA